MAAESLPVVHYLTDEVIENSDLGDVVRGVYGQIASHRWVNPGATSGMTDFDLLRARPEIVTDKNRNDTLFSASDFDLLDPEVDDLTTRLARRIFIETFQQHLVLREIAGLVSLEKVDPANRENFVRTLLTDPAFLASRAGTYAMTVTAALSTEPLEVLALTDYERDDFPGRNEYIEQSVREAQALEPHERFSSMLAWLIVRN